MTEPENIPEPDGEHFSFGAFNREYLAKREGMSMLVLDSMDEAQDRAEYLEKNLHVFEPFEFKRLAKQPDGSSQTVGFSLTFLDDPALPDMPCFTCKQWRPDLFWKPDYQSHANGALNIARPMSLRMILKVRENSLMLFRAATESLRQKVLPEPPPHGVIW